MNDLKEDATRTLFHDHDDASREEKVICGYAVTAAANDLQWRRLRVLLTTALPVVVTLMWRR
jgi:hypothetical protein